MKPTPRYDHRDTGLLQMLAVYLSVILLLQGLAAAIALGAGPLHRHGQAPAPLAALAFSHHGHAHASGERHHHDAGDSSVVPDPAAQAALDQVAAALTAALSLLALDTPRSQADPRRHVLHATPAWVCCSALPAELYRPPRRG